jgi:hypothetical protein
MVRPRERDREDIAHQLLEWVKLPDSINLCGFCISLDPPISPSVLLRMLKDDAILSQAYEIAKATIGDRREKNLNAGKLHVKAYDLNAETYDGFMRDEKRNKAEFESNLRKQEESSKETTFNIYAPNGLATGIDVSTTSVPSAPDKGA